MELDPITKWIIRVSSSMIIAVGFILVFAIPLLLLKISSIISLTQVSIQSVLKDILTGLLSNL